VALALEYPILTTGGQPSLLRLTRLVFPRGLRHVGLTRLYRQLSSRTKVGLRYVFGKLRALRFFEYVDAVQKDPLILISYPGTLLYV